MLKNPQDRRAKRTAMQIKQVMLTLMEQKAIHEITASEICKICQINRATFYDHYRNVFDLAQDLELDMLQKIEALMDTVSPDNTPDDVINRLAFDFLTEHKRTLTILFTSEQSQRFIRQLDEKLITFFEKKIRQNYEIPAGMETQLRSTLEFAATGYYRFFMKVLTASPREALAEAELCARLSDACLQVLFQKKASISPDL